MVKNKYRKTYKAKRKKSFFKKKYFWVSFLTILIIGEIFFLIFFCSFFKVREINILGNEKITDHQVSSLVWDKIKKKILFWDSRNIILASNNLSNKIKRKYPEIMEANIDKNLPDALTVIIKEREPDFIWCSKENCFITDKNGIIFEEAKKGKEFPLIIDKTKSKIPTLGNKVTSKKNLNNILKIKKEINKYEISISAFIIEENRLVVRTKKEWEIYFDLEKDIEWQITKLKANLEEEIPQEKREELEYIELRFGNFAPYKFK